jgi:hypothetical protein
MSLARAQVRPSVNCMRAPRFISGLLLGIAFVGFIVALLIYGTPYQRFMSNELSYYAEFASTCDSLLQQYPVDGTAVVELPGVNGLLLPEVIRKLYPESVIVSKDRVWISLDSSPESEGVSITWQRDPTEKNSWSLEAHHNGVAVTVYPQRKYASGVAPAQTQLKIACVIILSVFELASLFFIIRLWRSKASQTLGYRLWWSVGLCIPFLGVLLYILITEEPPMNPSSFDEGGGGWG